MVVLEGLSEYLAKFQLEWAIQHRQSFLLELGLRLEAEGQME